MVVLAMVLGFALVLVAGVLLAVHLGFRATRRVETGNPADFALAYDEIRIPTVGGKRLHAWWVPARPAAPVVIILHGWGANAELMLPLAVPLHRSGLNVVLLDARNHGRSDGVVFSSLPRFAQDVGAAVDWVKAHGDDPKQRVVLLGHSVGAAAVLLEASRRDDVAAVISIAAFAHPESMMHRYLGRFGVPGFLQGWIVRYVEWVIGHRFDEIAPVHTACRVRCPVLLVHGTADETVPANDAVLIREHCRQNRPALLWVDGGGHDAVEQVEQHAARLVDFLRGAGLVFAP